MTRLRRGLFVALFVVLTALGIASTLQNASARPSAPTPVVRVCDRMHPLECERAIAFQRKRAVRAEAAVAWQKHARVSDVKREKGYGVMHALRLAAAAYGVPYAQLERVASCESHLDPNAKNRSSTASGLMQFLRSTWARAGLPGFSVFDPYANALAGARLVARDGGFREWSCGWAAT